MSVELLSTNVLSAVALIISFNVVDTSLTLPVPLGNLAEPLVICFTNASVSLTLATLSALTLASTSVVVGNVLIEAFSAVSSLANASLIFA